ncbi:ABC transporter ATP-binding protein [Candidatus Woesearchaeota archaeon]|nr:ABC transporter ATP-binding protein [Candidatus Woesearchaeota archaeon]
MQGPALLKIANLTKSYGNKLVLNNVTMDIDDGEIIGIIGMSGAGKTTLLECMVGFTRPEQGDVLMGTKSSFGESFVSTSKQKEFRKYFGFAAQFPSFYNQLTIRENLEYFGALYGLSKSTIKNNSEILINLVGLQGEGDTVAGTLSGGMQKRLDVACALIHGPKILILDEPTADLDPISRKHMVDLIRRINSQGTTVIVASHLFDEIEQMCKKISILHSHSIKAVGTAHELKHHYRAKNLEEVFEAIVK